MLKEHNNFSSNGITKKDLMEHSWICSANICLKTLKELEKTFLNYDNIWKWEKQLDRCNMCYLEDKHYSLLNKTTRWEVSNEVNAFKNKNK